MPTANRFQALNDKDEDSQLGGDDENVAVEVRASTRDLKEQTEVDVAVEVRAGTRDLKERIEDEEADHRLRGGNEDREVQEHAKESFLEMQEMSSRLKEAKQKISELEGRLEVPYTQSKGLAELETAMANISICEGKVKAQGLIEQLKGTLGTKSKLRSSIVTMHISLR